MEPLSAPLPAFRVDQTGYAAGLPVRAACLSDAPVRLLDGAGREIRAWEACSRPADEASGDRVGLLDPGPLPEGDYVLEGGGERRRFAVRRRPWAEVTRALIRGLYFQRCGCGLDEAHAGAYRHPPCHTAEAALWERPEIRRRVPGGWHDAGDYGKYVGPGAVAAAHLLYAWKLFPRGCSDPLDLPETGNGVPDILNEARYELEWILRMQRDDGAFFHKLTKARFAPFIMPQDDLQPEYLMPVSHCATAAACACLALAARVFGAFDAAFAERALTAARRAWDWLEANPDFVPFRNPEGVRTGQYGEPTDADDRFWAACELYAAAGDARCRRAAEALYAKGLRLTQFGWADVSGLGALCCLTDLRGKDGPVPDAVLERDFLAGCEEALALSRASGYGTALAPDRYVWGSILPILSHAMALILGYRLTGREEMRDAALLQWHYALGLNALDICFVTGFGERSVLHPHHRPSEADGIPAPVPGLIAGGPNSRFPYPATRERLGADTPPAQCYLDETPSADTNEIAVYWNTPAVFVGAFFNALTAD